MTNLDLDVKCIQPYQDGMCGEEALASIIANTDTRGITDCTVGLVGTGANHASVADAIAAGCLSIRVIGNPGGTYEEPAGFDISGAVGPVMLYIDPGVTWVWRESKIGASGINLSGQTLSIRGSGWDSTLQIINDLVLATMVLTTATSNLFLMDMRLETDGLLTFLGFAYNLLYVRNCDLVCNPGDAAVTVFSGSLGGSMEFHSCMFVGGSVTARMIGASIAPTRLIINDCTVIGTFLPSATGDAFDLSTPFETLVDGLLCQQTGTLGINISGGSAQGIQQSDLSPAQAVQVTLSGTTPSLADSQVSNIAFSGAGGARITNVEVIDGGATTTTTISNANNLLTGCTFGGDVTIPLSITGNQLTSFSIGGTLAVLGGDTLISNGIVTNVMNLGVVIGILVGSINVSGVHCLGVSGATNSIAGVPATNVTDYITVDECEFDTVGLSGSFGNYRIMNCVFNDSNISCGNITSACANVEIINNKLNGGATNNGDIDVSTTNFALDRVFIDRNIIAGHCNLSLSVAIAGAPAMNGSQVSNNHIFNGGGDAFALGLAFAATVTTLTNGFKIQNNIIEAGSTTASLGITAIPGLASVSNLSNLEISENRINGPADAFTIISLTTATAFAAYNSIDIHDNIVVNNTATAINVQALSVNINQPVKVNNNIVGVDFTGVAGGAGITLPAPGVGFARTIGVGNVLGGTAGVPGFSLGPEIASGNLLT